MLESPSTPFFLRSHKEAAHVSNFYLDGVLLEKQVNPVYLGAKLDRQLNMIPLVDSLKEKASRRLRLIKRLATTTWGANKETLRNLYLGYSGQPWNRLFHFKL